MEYGSDLDTLKYCSGFSKKRPNSSGIEGAEYKTHVPNDSNSHADSGEKDEFYHL